MLTPELLAAYTAVDVSAEVARRGQVVRCSMSCQGRARGTAPVHRKAAENGGMKDDCRIWGKALVGGGCH